MGCAEIFEDPDEHERSSRPERETETEASTEDSENTAQTTTGPPEVLRSFPLSSYPYVNTSHCGSPSPPLKVADPVNPSINPDACSNAPAEVGNMSGCKCGTIWTSMFNIYIHIIYSGRDNQEHTRAK